MTPSLKESVSVLICTYRRPHQLRWLLEDLARQTRLPDEVVVVDNDVTGSARATVERFAAGAPFALRYDVQPKKSISLTRNRTVALASGEWLGFLDDDERVEQSWLELMVDCAQRYAADGVLGPVLCQPPDDAPAWIRRGNFYALQRGPTGIAPPLNRMWIGNALLRGTCVRAQPGPFDEAFGQTGGEDTDLLARLTLGGARMSWCDEALVTEPVVPARLTLKWILLRALGTGQVYIAHWRRGRYGALRWYSRPLLALRALAQCALAAALALLTLPLGRHHAAQWLRKAAANAGKLSALGGWRYREYAAPATAAGSKTPERLTG